MAALDDNGHDFRPVRHQQVPVSILDEDVEVEGEGVDATGARVQIRFTLPAGTILRLRTVTRVEDLVLHERCIGCKVDRVRTFEHACPCGETKKLGEHVCEKRRAGEVALLETTDKTLHAEHHARRVCPTPAS